ncbi:MAG: FecR family protein [Fibrobacter sp.]|nr:FecR family protein [Fibrobacter sp.]
MKRIFTVFFTLLLVLAGCNGNKDQGKSGSGSDEAKKNGEEESVDDSKFVTTASSIIGDVLKQPGGQGDIWKQIRIGQKVIEDDRVQTRIESEAKLVANEGSIFVISENSDVTLKSEQDSIGSKIVLVAIGNGKVYFDVQKQRNAYYKMKTGNANAAIRGTAGFVGIAKNKTVVSLKEGQVDVSSKTGQKKMLLENQTVLVDENGDARMLDLASSGTEYLVKVIDSLTAVIAELTSQSLEMDLKTFDDSYAERQKAYKKSLEFKSSPLDSLYVPSVTLQARVTPGTIVTVWGERVKVGDDGFYRKEFSWGINAYGKKRFIATCSDGNVEVECYRWVAQYVPPEGYEEPPTIDDLVVDLGERDERIHVDPPATKYNTNMKINLAGIAKSNLKEIDSIVIRRGKRVVKTIRERDLTSLEYELPIELNRNKIVDFEVVVAAKNGKNYSARKTYEAFCLITNHPGGKARNRIVSERQEYQRLVQSNGLSRE